MQLWRSAVYGALGGLRVWFDQAEILAQLTHRPHLASTYADAGESVKYILRLMMATEE